ncbi:hypothetical protein HDC90_003621 [Pedobacter sp. AK013]|nr:hypothetical protein [Pedobacter sp. AK013]
MDADTQSVLFNVIDTYIQNSKTKKLSLNKTASPTNFILLGLRYNYGISHTRHAYASLGNICGLYKFFEF